MSLGMLIDLSVICLLIFGCVGGWLINRRISKLVSAQQDLRAALESFDAAAARADAAGRDVDVVGPQGVADLAWVKPERGELLLRVEQVDPLRNHAVAIDTRPVEHADCKVIAGPRRPSLNATRVAR